MDLTTIEEKALEHLVKVDGVFDYSPTFFPFTSGTICPYKIRAGNITADPEAHRFVIDSMADMIASTVDLKDVTFTGGESSDFDFMIPTACKLGRPYAKLFKDGRITGAYPQGNVVHIADVNSQGSSLRDYWVPTIKRCKGTIDTAFLFVDRMDPGGQETLRKLGLTAIALVNLNVQAWDYLLSRNFIPQSVVSTIAVWQQDPESWAMEMLQSKEGKKRFQEIAHDPHTRERAGKIIRAYPDMAEELRRLL